VNKKTELVAAVAPLEIVSRYEAPFRAAGMLPGLVTTSALAALELAPEGAITVFVKITGRVLSCWCEARARSSWCAVWKCRPLKWKTLPPFWSPPSFTWKTIWAAARETRPLWIRLADGGGRAAFRGRVGRGDGVCAVAAWNAGRG